ncbi:MAG: cadherin-like beta sandwich domain-containing protein, partial [Syntrophomonas sp.]
NITGCDVVCLTGDATVQGNNDQTGQSLTGGTSTSINNGGNAAGAGTLTEEEKNKLAQAAVQQWLVNTALNMNNNKEAKIQMVVEVPDNTANPEQSALDVVLKALKDSGITLNEEVRKELEGKLTEALENTQTPPDSDPGESSVNYINYAAAGTYGPENAADIQTISKNVIISAPGITLRNMVITKDLTLGAGIGEGDITLENVKVQGNTKILGGGSNSITLIDCELYTVTVDKDEVRIVAKGTSAIGALTLNAGATLTESDLTGAGFSTVSTGLTLPAGARITFSGNFEAVNINAPDLTIQVDGGSIDQMNIAATASGTALTLAAGSSVAALEINAQANIGGTGQISNAIINVLGVEMQHAPLHWSTASGVNVSIGGESRSGSSYSNAKLGSLSLGGISFNQSFAPDTLNYTASVANSVYQATLVAIPQESTASAEVNGVNQTENTHILNLIVGANPINIVVTSQDGTTMGYTVTITRAGSSSCAVTVVNSPPGATISGSSITANVAGSVSSLTVDVSVSPYATWKLYSDNACINEIVYQPLSLAVGSNQSYIKVAAQNGTSESIYSLNIYRLSNDATAASAGSHYIVDNTGNSIQADQTVINTNVTVESFLANLTKHVQASWKVIAEGTTIGNQTQFDSAAAKSSTDTLLFGDMLAVKAEDGTIKVYAITVVLGDPVIITLSPGSIPAAPSGWKKSTPFSNYNICYGMIWGNYTYWCYDDNGNWCNLKIIAYNSSNTAVKTWDKTGTIRYIEGITFDSSNVTFIGQSGATLILSRTELMVP